MKDKKMSENGRNQNRSEYPALQPGKSGIYKRKGLKLGSALLTLVMMLTLLSGTLFAAVWGQSGLNSTNNVVVSYETPVSAQEASLAYRIRVRDEGSYDAISNIVLADGYAYVATGRSLLKISAAGEIAAQAQLTASVHQGTPSIVYADDHIYTFVEADGQGFVEAVNAANMTTAWTSTAIADYQALSAMTISDGMLYIPVSHYDYENWRVQAPGAILALDTRSSDDEPQLKVLFEDTEMSFSGNKVALTEQYVYIGSQEGDLLAINREDGTPEAKAVTGQSIKSAITIAGQFLYFGTESGVGQIEIDENGLFITESLQLLDLGIQSTTTPVVYQDRLYAGTGHFGGGKGMHVIDTKSMEVLFTAETAGYDSWADVDIESAGIQSSPVLTTAYDDGVYLYYTINAVPGSLMTLKYESGSLDAEAAEIFVPDEEDQNYTMADIVAGEQGVLYFTNDSGYLFAVGKSEAAEETEETEEADETEQEAIPPTGRLAGTRLVIMSMLTILSLSLAAGLVLSGRKDKHNEQIKK